MKTTLSEIEDRIPTFCKNPVKARIYVKTQGLFRPSN